MPRTKCCRDPDQEMRERLFGFACISDIARLTGIDKTTLGRRKKNPRELRLGELEAICKVQGMKIVITKPDYVLEGR